MTKLLRAGNARMKRDKIFWLDMAFMVLIGLIVPVKNYFENLDSGYTTIFDKYLFGNVLFIGVIASIFSSLFTGTEYSDGTIRNKIVVGHTRNAVYFSNFILNTASALIMHAAFLIAVSAVGLPLFGMPEMDAVGIVLFLLCSICMIAACTAIFTLIAMLIQNKAIVAVVSILMALALLLLGSYTQSRLDAPEFYEGVTFMSNDGGMMITTDGGEGEPYPNPMYLRGTEREIYQFIYDFLPGGQAIQIYMLSVAHPWRLMLYSLVIVALTTGCGLWFFRKKDIQ